MRMTSRRLGRHAKNYGISKRAKPIINSEIEKTRQKTFHSHNVDSKNLTLYRQVTTYPCSCTHVINSEVKNVDGSNADFEIPMINLGSDDVNEADHDVSVDAALEFLEQQKETCGICFGTGNVGGYKKLNCFEHYLEPQKYETLENVTITKGKPYAFKPDGIGSVVFTVNIPLYHEGFEVKSIVEDTWGPVKVSVSSDGVNWAPLTNETSGDNYIKFVFSTETKGFLLRFNMGPSTVKVNFPFVDLALLSGEFDYWDSVSVAIDPSVTVTTKDVLIDSDNNVWRVTNVSPKVALGIDTGKDATLRKCKDWEVYNKLI